MRSLDELFARYPAPFQPRSPLVSLAGGGGLSGSQLWRYRAERGDLLVRAWPRGGPGRKHVEQVHRWLGLTASLGFVPLPVHDCAGQSVQEWRGLLWEIAPWLPGSADPSHPPAPEHVRLAFAGLGAFHQRLACEQVDGFSAGLRQRQHEIVGLLEGGLDSLATAIRQPAHGRSPSLRAALAWLALARQAVPAVLEPLALASGLLVHVQPVLRDARPEHFLFEGGRLSGLVDFGAMGVDSVAADLARLIGDWFDGDDLGVRRDALAAYEAVRPLDANEARLISAFEATAALLIGEHWVRWHFVENRQFDDPQAVFRGIDRGLIRLERLVCQMATSRLSF